MFRLKITTNTERRPEIVTPTTQKIAEALEQNGISTTGATVSLNGRILDAPDYGKTFSESGVTAGQTAILSVVVKADSAAA